MTVSRRLERALLAVGLSLMAVFAVAKVYGWISASLALQRFEESRDNRTIQDGGPVSSASVDCSLWSAQRIREYKESLNESSDLPLAVLSIPKLRLEVPVFDGTDELTLNRGAGRIIGTARPGQSGNVGIAGHRDGFFRGLKDVVVGDRIELKTPARTETYKVAEIRIVRPSDVDVLAGGSIPTLTLVTCYPFYFIGNAPQRYIVRATASDDVLNRK